MIQESVQKDPRTYELGKFGPLRARRTFLVHKKSSSLS